MNDTFLYSYPNKYKSSNKTNAKLIVGWNDDKIVLNDLISIFSDGFRYIENQRNSLEVNHKAQY
jgi:hypothetical protein